MTPKSKKLVVMGDSITDCGRARPVGEGMFGALGNGYVSLLDAMLGADHPDWRLRTVNMGVDGNTSRELVGRWRQDALDQQPEIVAVLVGINDVWRQFDSPLREQAQVPPEEYEQNLCRMAESTLPTACRLLFISPFFLEPDPEEPMRARMDQYRAIMKETAGRYGLEFVDLQEAFAPLLKTYHPSFIAWDRVHPGPVGQLVIARSVMAGLERAAAGRQALT